MAVKTFYFKDAVPTGATLHRSLQDGGTAPTAATTTTGWVAATRAAADSCIQTGGTEYSRTGGNWGTTLQPSAAPSQTIGDCWRSENTLSGDFANTNWTFNFGFRSVTAAYTGRLKLAVRVWRSANANGTGAVELTGGRVVSAATTANLSTTADTTLSWTWTPGAVKSLSNEYLFINVGIEITSAGSGTTQDFDFRVNSTYTVVTSDFTVPVTTINATPGADSWAGTTSSFATMVLATIGAFTWAGVGAVVTVPPSTVVATPGTNSWSGTQATVPVQISGTVGAYSWSGTSSSIAASINATTGNQQWTGTVSEVPILFSQSIGAYTWQGINAAIAENIQYVGATSGAFGWKGVTASLVGTHWPSSFTILAGVTCHHTGVDYTGMLVAVLPNSIVYDVNGGKLLKILSSKLAISLT